MKKRIICLVLCFVLIFSVTAVAGAMITDSFIQLVHIEKDELFDTQITTFYDDLEEAFKNAQSGDIIEIFDDGEVTSTVTVPSDLEITVVSGTKREHAVIYGRSAFEYTDQNATQRTLKKNFDGSLFTLSQNSKVTFENITLDGNKTGGIKGGLIYLVSGASMMVKRGVNLQNSTLGANSFGGAVYAEKGSAVTIEDTVFSDNNALSGRDIYAESKDDIKIAADITADFAYPSAADINGLNLILTGEIGLNFHIAVQNEYLDGTIVLSCRMGEPLTYKISECEKDKEGRYTAKYNVSAVELSEQVTVTVYDKDGFALATKQKSVEDYGILLLEDKATTETEKNVITALLNYGHFAQIDCAEYEGWEIGKDYAETQKYAELSMNESEFEKYTFNWTGHDEGIPKIGVQLNLDYKTGITLYFPCEEKPSVTLNGEEKAVQLSEVTGYNYLIKIKDISALDLAKQFTLTVNEKVTVTFSALSYCESAIWQNGENSKNAVKALYEFYFATVEYNR